ncbi:MAG TPA: SAM-dependent methyltransferase [Cytophagales bacterium]|jgi:16S rRNA (cytidine1402-2'-O)-methyltransferase|nr:SAM-dependent methyltransferase [Cytophagales bacterium]
MSESKKGKLYLIPNVLAPGTQHEVMSKSVTEAILQCRKFLVEDLRAARRYISSLKLGIAIEDLHFEILNKNTPEKELPDLLQVLLEGQNIGIISEAGCPGIADPGAKAVNWAHRKGLEVVPLVGPSSILLALISSGFNGQQFVFHGYLPISQNELIRKIQNMENELGKFGTTQVFMETPYRNNKLLKFLVKRLRNETLLCIASELTAPNQFIGTKSVAKWKKALPDLHKKPTVFLIGR